MSGDFLQNVQKVVKSNLGLHIIQLICNRKSTRWLLMQITIHVNRNQILQ
jgi:hypothetical protein